MDSRKSARGQLAILLFIQNGKEDILMSELYIQVHRQSISAVVTAWLLRRSHLHLNGVHSVDSYNVFFSGMGVMVPLVLCHEFSVIDVGLLPVLGSTAYRSGAGTSNMGPSRRMNQTVRFFCGI